jgi:hypothetical protein
LNPHAALDHDLTTTAMGLIVNGYATLKTNSHSAQRGPRFAADRGPEACFSRKKQSCGNRRSLRDLQRSFVQLYFDELRHELPFLLA